jgi:hypothetical protein
MNSPKPNRPRALRSPKRRIAATLLSILAGELAFLLLLDRKSDPYLYFFLLLPLFAVSVAVLLWGEAEPVWVGILCLLGVHALALGICLPPTFALAGAVPSWLFPLAAFLLALLCLALRLPQRLCGAVRAKRKPAVRFGVRHRVFDRYLPMLHMAASPTYSYERQPPSTVLGRATLSVLFGSAGLLLLRFALWNGPWPLLIPAVFLLMLAPMVVVNGLVMGAASALCGTAVAPGLSAGAFIASRMAMPLALRVLLWAILLLLLPFLFYFALRYWHRRLALGAAVRREGELLVGVATRRGDFVSLSEDLRGYTRLWRATLEFEPFPNCEEYYLHKRWADFCLFCRMRGLRPVGYRAESEPVITYYLYAKTDRGVERALSRFFSDWKKTNLSVASREDGEWRGYSALLPSAAAVHRSHHEILFSMIRPPEGVRFRLRHLSYFGKEDAARAFLEAAAETGTYSALTVEEEGEEFMAILEETVEVSMHMMNARTDVLAELAEKSGGEYYTWEVQGAEPV